MFKSPCGVHITAEAVTRLEQAHRPPTQALCSSESHSMVLALQRTSLEVKLGIAAAFLDSFLTCYIAFGKKAF